MPIPMKADGMIGKIVSDAYNSLSTMVPGGAPLCELFTPSCCVENSNFAWVDGGYILTGGDKLRNVAWGTILFKWKKVFCRILQVNNWGYGHDM